jgi:hypothetical protein
VKRTFGFSFFGFRSIEISIDSWIRQIRSDLFPKKRKLKERRKQRTSPSDEDYQEPVSNRSFTMEDQYIDHQKQKYPGKKSLYGCRKDKPYADQRVGNRSHHQTLNAAKIIALAETFGLSTRTH